MRYAVFYPVNNNKGYERHTFDNIFDDKIVAEMLREVKGIKVYNLESTNRSKEVGLFASKMTTTMRNLMEVIG